MVRGLLWDFPSRTGHRAGIRLRRRDVAHVPVPAPTMLLAVFPPMGQLARRRRSGPDGFRGPLWALPVLGGTRLGDRWTGRRLLPDGLLIASDGKDLFTAKAMAPNLTS
jgi:hypothetical protein